MYSDPQHFDREPFRDFGLRRQQVLEDEVRKLDGTYVLSLGEEGLVAALVEKHRIESPDLSYDLLEVEILEVLVPQAGWSGQQVEVPGLRAIGHVPVEGPTGLFDLTPQRFESIAPRGVIQTDELRLTEDLPGVSSDAAPRVEQALNRRLEAWRRWTSWLRSDIQQWNAELVNVARRAVQARAERATAAKAVRASLTVPLFERREARSIVSLSEKRSDLPPVAEGRFTEYQLDVAGFEDILGRLRLMRQVIEHSPSAFEGISEEHLRFHFLVTLNALFGLEGAATAETFNFSGKTDILIRHKGSVLFVAECKFWRGASRFSDAIDQLAGYLSWRDSRAALLLFVRSDMSRVVESADACVKRHSAFARAISAPDGEGRYRCRLPSDSAKEFDLALLPFWVPGGAARSGGRGRISEPM